MTTMTTILNTDSVFDYLANLNYCSAAVEGASAIEIRQTSQTQ